MCHETREVQRGKVSVGQSLPTNETDVAYNQQELKLKDEETE